MSDERFAITLVSVIGILAGLALLIFIALPKLVRGDEGSPGPPVHEVYARIAEALRRDGMVALVTERCVSDDPVSCRISARRYWIDVVDGNVRTESTYRSTEGDVTDVRIIRDGVEHLIDPNSGELLERPVDCTSERPAALSIFGSCYSLPSEIVPEARISVRFDARDAIMIRWKGKYSGIDSTVSVHNRLYIDAETLLPLAFKTSSADDYALGDTSRRSSERRFLHEFVPRESLPAAFFDASSASNKAVPVPISPP